MRRVLTMALASVAIGLATPAAAAVNVTTTNGTPLQAAIHASTTDNTNDALEVFGSITQGGQSANVKFDGNTDLHITDGGGFASITDSSADGALNLTSLIINPDADFTAIKFSIQLAGDGDISIFYLLSGLADLPANYVLAGGTPFSQKDNQNNNYILTGGTFNAIKIVTTSHLFEVKQNSINLAAAFVPEPGTWGLMLLGFGGIGLALRRRRRTATLMQLA